jgi:hypothetical protein
MFRTLLMIVILCSVVYTTLWANPNEPPIHIIFDVHIEPIEGGPNYFQRRTEVNWLRETALAHGATLTLESNGEYMEYCLEHGHQADFQAFLDAGFDVGTHSHLVTYEGPHQWVNRYGEELTFDLVDRIISDAEAFVDSVIGAENNFHLCTQTNKAYIDTMMHMHDFRFVTGPGEEGYWYFGHQVWNPFRPASSEGSGVLEEDLTAPYVTIPHLPQINKPEAHGMNLLLPQMKRRFLMIYLEWLYRVRNGVDDKIWVWGFNTHACQNFLQRDAVEEMLQWLNEYFVNHTVETGDTIAVYATGSEIYRKYLDWEANHPGVSSFSYVDGDPYPYTYEAMPTLLNDAAYDTCFEMDININTHGFRKNGKPLFIAWTDSGTAVLDLSSFFPETVRTTDGHGIESVQNSSQLIVSEEPLFIESAPSHIPYESSRFGIFGAYALEYDWFMGQMGFDASEYWDWVDGHFEHLGAHWTRSNTQLIWELIEPDLDGNYVWEIPTNPDGVITNVCDSPAEVNWLGCIHVGMGRDGLRNPLDHPARWQNFLKAVVDRYNGDGNNDLNSNVRVKYWQLGNEIFSLIDAGLTPEEYAEIVALSETAIRSVDPEAKICLIAPTTGKHVDPFLEQSIRAIADQEVLFDVIDIHHWDTAKQYKMDAVQLYRQLLDNLNYGNVEIWSCEHGTWCYQPDHVPAQTKTEQARSLVKRYLWNCANGLDKLFWNNLMEWHGFGGQAGSIFNAIGLVGDGSFCGEPPAEFNHLRKAYHSYQKLAEDIDAHRSEYIGINEFHDEERGHYGYIYDDVETDTLLQFIWTDSVKTYANVAVGSPSLWTNVIPSTDEGNFESITLEPGEYMFPIEPGDVFLLKGMAMPIREIEKGDVNSDGRINIQDVLRVVRLILHQPPPPTEYELWAADYNDDGRIDILDVIGIVNEILRGGL